ncbi:I78 family peptidase inhibitor [Paracoccus sp. M683]|uniref:I78 family peptidase inhibitor n=1 Tax=Paracoccus sp. M683 TaxID=2594268 RepID=UPI00163D6AD2|nr:I78 family peptidase inhibitor [Paracoccus sp. M683]
MRHPLPALTLGLLMLAACETAPPAVVPTVPAAGATAGCTDAYQSLVGSNIGAVTLPTGLSHRIIPPNTAYTEDFSPDRLNIFVDDKGWITRVTCG